MTFRLLPLILIPGALLVLPTGAGAAEFCVATTTPCTVPLQNVPTLSAAMTAAQNLPTADTIRVGPGVHAGPFTYGGGGPLTITGEGIGTTVLTSPTGQVIGGLSGAVTVRDLTVRAGDQDAAIGVNLAGGTLERVRVEGGASDSGRAVLVTGGGTLDRVEVDAPRGTAVRVNGGTPEIRRSRIGGRVYAFDEDLTMVDTRVEGKGIDGGGPSAKFTLRNVLIAVDAPGVPGLRMANGDVDADHLTVVHRGGAAAGTPGVLAAPGASVTLESSIVSGFPVSVKREASDDPVGPTDLRVHRSSYAFDRVVDVPGASGGVIELGPGNVNTEKGFVAGAAGDYRLRGDALQVDRGALTGITALELGGFARTVDGDGDGDAQTDMGALEYRRLAPKVTVEAPATAVAGQPVAVRANATDADGDTVTYAWSFGASGAAATRTFTASGPQTVTVRATDSGGRTDTATATVQVAPAPVEPKTDKPQTTPPVRRDTTKPKLSSLKLKTRRFKPSKVTLKAAKGGALRLKLSEPARVELRVERPAKRGTWKRAAGKTTLQAPAGTSTFRFRGGLGKRLARGRYRLVLVATDAAGNRSAAKRITFTVIR